MPEIRDGKTLFTQAELQPLFDAGAIINGSNGGLLLGNSHSEGGVKVIKKLDDKLYEVVAELEGWEYIICAEGTYRDEEYLATINGEFDGTSENFTEYEIPRSITKIDTRLLLEDFSEISKILIFGEYAHFIINKNSTKKYLKELDALNKKYCD
jgi:hypothetical protein